MKKIRLALAQINPTVGDIEKNAEKIIDYIKKAQKKEVDIIAFPELAITGYPPEDLLLKDSFINANLEAVKKIALHTKDIIVIVGFVDKQEDIYNAAGVLYNGEIVGIYHKNYLPNYGVFDEVRYFQKGNEITLLNIEGYKIGLSICEDIWYPENPINIQAIEGAELIININASPYTLGKINYREEMLKVRAKDNFVSIAYVNMVGGQDELVFDGSSSVILPNGNFEVRGKSFEEDLLVCDIDLDAIFRNQLKDNRLRNLRAKYKREERVKEIFLDYKIKKHEIPLNEKIVLNSLSEAEEIYKALVLGLKDYIKKNGFEKVVIGLSGGIDSSLVATIATDAL
ncbi:nitrilase-related carbon-nitrogen hydrolase, partial [Hydrogenivirga sp. 128-5-R1-1]|uniref:nitrilase-related carbon-nitrogen hydrolase n=1 Tax=Hydrogenivirga sp. 128-5-R1-1 TaxID=392423 RepID=UPI00015F2760